MTNNKKKKIPWGQYMFLVLSTMITAAFGYFISIYFFESIGAEDRTIVETLLLSILLLLYIYAAIFLQLAIHEAGHLIFGLLTGFSFLSYRIGSFMWVKENEKLKIKRMSIAGTGGQCLMNPPENPGEKPPFILFNLGGSITNIVCGLLFFGLFFLFKNMVYFSGFLLFLGVFGIFFALFNGIPMKLGMVNNDGYNALSLGKNPEALRSFYTQLKVVGKASEGTRIKDMPEEWFFRAEVKDSISLTMDVFGSSRLMDMHRFVEADQLMSELLETDYLAGLHRHLLTSERMYCELIGENRKDVLESLADKKQRKFMKSMRKNPSILRTEYGYALLAEKDSAKAVKIMTEFEKVARTYPVKSEIESEREFIDIINSITVR